MKIKLIVIHFFVVINFGAVWAQSPSTVGADLCDQKMADRLGMSAPMDLDFQSWIPIIQSLNVERYRSAWERSLYPSASLRAHLLVSTETSWDSSLKSRIENAVKSLYSLTKSTSLKKHMNLDAKMYPRGRANDKPFLGKSDLLEYFSSKSSTYKVFDLTNTDQVSLINLACTKMIGIRNRDCSLEFKNIFELSMGVAKPLYEVSDFYATPDVENLSHVFSDTKYIDGLLLASKIILSRFVFSSLHQGSIDAEFVRSLEKYDFKVDKQSSPQARLFDDLTSAFFQTGDSLKSAQDKAWDVIGAISSRGINLIVLLDHTRDIDHFDDAVKDEGYLYRSMIPLRIIASALPFLDHYSSHKFNGMYSLPKQIVGTCNTGKSYHFLLSAYLSRKIYREYGNKDKAAAVAFLSSVAYAAIIRNAVIYDNIKSSFPPPESSAGFTIKTDLSYSAMGAFWGAYEAEQVQPAKIMSLDSLIENYVGYESNKILDGIFNLMSPNTPSTMYEKAVRFYDLYHPDFVFSEALKASTL